MWIFAAVVAASPQEPVAGGKPAEDILNVGIFSQQAVAQAMADLWNRVLNSPLYDNVAKLGAWFAYGTIALFIVLWVKDALEDELSAIAWEKWLWLAVVVALLTNKGALLKECTFGIRDLMNGVNEQVLTSTLQGSQSLIDAFNEVSQMSGVQGWYEQQVRSCQSISDSTQRQTCLDKARSDAQKLAQSSASATQPNLWQRIQGAAAGVFNFGTFLEAVLLSFLLALAIAVQWLVEITWILTAAAGPIALGGTLLPVRQKSLFAWLIAFYSIGLYKLFFNILIGMVAMVQLGAGSVNSLVFAIAVGVLSPVLALTLAAGGGWATLTSLATVTGAVGAKVGAAGFGAASGAGKMGARMAAHPVMRRAGAAYQSLVPQTWRRRIRGRIQDATTPLSSRR